MYSNQVRQRVRGLVAGLGPSIISNPDQLEAKLADLAPDNPEDVKAIVAAARGGVAEEIAAAAPEHRAEMVEQAAAWMASETALPGDLSRWAVETWNEALQGVQMAPPALAQQPQPNAAPIGAPAGGPPPAPWDAPRSPAGGPPPAPWDTPRAPQPPPGGSWQGQGGYGAPPPGAWPPSPQGYYPGQSWTNTSGTDGPVPPEIAKLKWNWGAFGVSFFWLIFHGLWPLAVGITVAIVVLNFLFVFLPISLWMHVVVIMAMAYAIQIALGFLGNKLAWQHRSYDSVQHFFAVEKVWMVWGIILACFGLFGLIRDIQFLTTMHSMMPVP